MPRRPGLVAPNETRERWERAPHLVLLRRLGAHEAVRRAAVRWRTGRDWQIAAVGIEVPVP